ncbi:MAG TPA: AAA family ATPase [Solirubrobacteraceae bacterium]|nr:AAA family ATPase [Solirubrobacteraceae bacterium]
MMAVDFPRHISEIAGQPAGGHAPGATAGSTSQPFLLGRAAECAAIDRLLEAAARGESGSLVLRGEAGMGKTALLGYAIDRAFGMTVLRATGVEAESDLAFAGLHALLRPIGDHLGELPEPQRAALAAALGLAIGEGANRFLVSAGVLSLLAAAAESRPVLCVVDDAQWLDAPSADALVFAARRLVAEGVAMVFGARDGEPARFDGAGLDEHVVAGLDRQSAAMLLGRGARQLEPSVRERLLADAGGNPLALLELPSALSGAQAAGREPLPEALPLSACLRTVFMQRIERLSGPARAALLVAGAADATELGAIRRAISDLELPEDALDPAEAIGLVRTDGATLAFRHPLVRAAVYESATAGQRQQVHAALARALRGGPDGARALWHQAMAAAAPDEAIAAALEESARQSQQRGGHASAATAFERAAQLTESEHARGHRLAAAAEAAWLAGQTDRARGVINRALPVADRPQRARLLYLAGTIEGHNGWLEAGVRTLEKAAGLSEDASLTLEILRVASGMATYVADYDTAVALGRRAATLTPASDVDRFNSAVVAALGVEMSGDYARGAELSAQAIEIAERLDDPVCLMWAALTAAREGIAADGLPYATRAVELARERALVIRLPVALQMQAAGLIGQSRFDLAYSTAEEGLRLAIDVGQPWAAGWNLAHLAMIDARRGAEQLARAHLDQLQARVAASGASGFSVYVGRALGLLDLGLGRPAQALEHLQTVIATLRPESHPLFVLALPDAVEAAVRAHREGEVAGHLDRFRVWVQRFPNPPRLALLARCLALVQEADAEPHYAQAIEFAPALSPFDKARTELLYGEWLRRQRRRVEARSHLRAALGVFEQLRVSPWEARARSELRASGETARRRDPSKRDELTPRELQIARFVADGMTNPRIAEQLFLSPRTIDYHLRKVFAKLEITSRADLVGVDLDGPIAA